jgi:hypothetical protein
VGVQNAVQIGLGHQLRQLAPEGQIDLLASLA